MNGSFDTCSVCPRLCRPACPVASGSTREASVPAVIAGVLYDWERGRADAGIAADAATLCTDCGACERHCHLQRPLPALLREARAKLLPEPPIAPLGRVEGEGTLLAIEADDRLIASPLSRRLGVPVRRLVTPDRLGVAAVEHPRWETRAAEIRACVGAYEVIVADGGVAEALTASGVAFVWLHDRLPELAVGTGSCRAPGVGQPLACCGAAGPLRTHHPADARRTGEQWLRRGGDGPVLDARCGDHLRACGGAVTDPVDQLSRIP